MTKRNIAIAAGTVFIATLSTVGCKKEETTTPTDTTTAADPDEVEADEPDEADEPADEAEAPIPLDKHSFHETIDEHMQEVSDCYVALLESNPNHKGKLEADFTFGADGVPTSVTAGSGSTLSDASLVECIANASKGWGFGIPKDEGMTLRYTFNLAPAG